MIATLKDNEGGNEEIFAVDHPARSRARSAARPLQEKTFSYMCSDPECELSIHKDQKGKYLFPETVQRLSRRRQGRTAHRIPGHPGPGDHPLPPRRTVEVEVETRGDDEDAEAGADPTSARREDIPDGTVAGSCPKCRARGVKSEVTRQGTGYRCALNIARKKDKECDFRLAERIKYRYLPFDQIQRMLAGEKTDELFGFVSMRGASSRPASPTTRRASSSGSSPPARRKPRRRKRQRRRHRKRRLPRRAPARRRRPRLLPRTDWRRPGPLLGVE